MTVRKRLAKFALIGILFTVSAAMVSCDYVTVVPAPTPEQRPGVPPEGSARWAFDIAKVRAVTEGYDPINDLYLIDGATIWNDGRLPANRGRWQFKFWNEVKDSRLEIEVNYNGEMKVNFYFKGDPPTANPPLPAGWVDSTIVFQAAPAFSIDVVQGAFINLSVWNNDPGEPFWTIGCMLSQNCPVYYIRWDGEYLGDSFP